MDPDDEAILGVGDALGGGDNLLNPVTSPLAAHPPTSQSDPAQDKNSLTQDYEPDSATSPNNNNSSTDTDTLEEGSPYSGSVLPEPSGISHPETKDSENLGEDSAHREVFDVGLEEVGQDVPSSVTQGSRIDDAGPEMLGGNIQGEHDGIIADVEEEEPSHKEEEDEKNSSENKEQPGELPYSDETENPSGQDESSEDPIHLKRRQRSDLYKEGLSLQETAGNDDQALGCYLAAITGLTEKEAFFELPQCLHRISNIYFEKKEYEKAVHFVQAEKMYYETALIDIVNLQTQLAESKKEEKGGEPGEEEKEAGPKTTPPEGADTPEIIKAKEYENLAKLCLKESKPQLALEYCGKATKVYREVYGDDHPVTVGSLDLFTMIYADVGKKLYADAMQKFDAEEKDLKESAEQPHSESSEKEPTAGEDTTSGLRHRSKSDGQAPSEPSAEPGPVGASARMEFEPAPQPDEQDDWVTTSLLMLLFFLITLLVLLIGSYFYCHGNETSSVCHQLKGDLSYWYMKIKHYYLGIGNR